MSLGTKKPRQTTPTAQIAETHWHGPLPPPSTLQQFDSVVSNGAERIFKMAEVEQAHRIEVEKASLELDIESHSFFSSFIPRRRAADSTVVRQGEVDKGRDGLEMESKESARCIPQGGITSAQPSPFFLFSRPFTQPISERIGWSL
jgi:hypothetical protein